MNLLEIKHLAPYLPYGLKLQYVVKGKVETTGVMNSIIHNDFEALNTKVSIDGLYNAEYIWMFKPILRPLSDLTKEIEHNGDNIFFLIDKLGWVRHVNIGFDIESFIFDIHVGSIEYSDTLILLEYHFDIFGLIPKGLAIDINKL